MEKDVVNTDFEIINSVGEEQIQEEEAIENKPYKKENTAGSWTSLILGIVGSLGWMVPIIGLPVTIVGTVFGAINMKNKKNRGVAIAGFIVNIVFLAGSVAKGILDIIKYMKKEK